MTGQGSKFYDRNDPAAEPMLQALVSGRGWSAYISTIGVSDPYSHSGWQNHNIEGVYHRNGVSRRVIMDVPIGNSTNMTQSWTSVEKAGDWATLRCEDDIDTM